MRSRRRGWSGRSSRCSTASTSSTVVAITASRPGPWMATASHGSSGEAGDASASWRMPLRASSALRWPMTSISATRAHRPSWWSRRMPSHGPWLALASWRRVRRAAAPGGGEALDVRRPAAGRPPAPAGGPGRPRRSPTAGSGSPGRRAAAGSPRSGSGAGRAGPAPGAAPQPAHPWCGTSVIGLHRPSVTGSERVRPKFAERHRPSYRPVPRPVILCNHVSMTSAAGTARLTAWFAGRIPDGWFVGPVEVAVDREEILVTGELAEPSVSVEDTDEEAADPRDRGPGPDRGVPGGHPGPAGPHRLGGRGPLRQEGVVGRALRRHRGGLHDRQRPGDDPSAHARAGRARHPHRRRGGPQPQRGAGLVRAPRRPQPGRVDRVSCATRSPRCRRPGPRGPTSTPERRRGARLRA